MVDQSNFVVKEDADPLVFPDYEATHGLPKLIAVVGAEPRHKTNLLTVHRSGLINFNDPKHAVLRGSARSLDYDAYLIWRLSERYGETSFRIGKLDKDRIIRLWQLHAIELNEPDSAEVAEESTFIHICWSRRSLQDHYGRLLSNVNLT